MTHIGVEDRSLLERSYFSLMSLRQALSALLLYGWYWQFSFRSSSTFFWPSLSFKYLAIMGQRSSCSMGRTVLWRFSSIWEQICSKSEYFPASCLARFYASTSYSAILQPAASQADAGLVAEGSAPFAEMASIEDFFSVQNPGVESSSRRFSAQFLPFTTKPPLETRLYFAEILAPSKMDSSQLRSMLFSKRRLLNSFREVWGLTKVIKASSSVTSLTMSTRKQMITKIDTILSKLEHTLLKHVFLEDSHESTSSVVAFSAKACSSSPGSSAKLFYMILQIERVQIITE